MIRIFPIPHNKYYQNIIVHEQTVKITAKAPESLYDPPDIIINEHSIITKRYKGLGEFVTITKPFLKIQCFKPGDLTTVAGFYGERFPGHTFKVPNNPTGIKVLMNEDYFLYLYNEMGYTIVIITGEEPSISLHGLIPLERCFDSECIWRISKEDAV